MMYISEIQKIWLIGQRKILESPEMNDIKPDNFLHADNRAAVKTLDGKYLLTFISHYFEYDMHIINIMDDGAGKLKLEKCEIVDSKCPIYGNDIYVVSVDENKYELIYGFVKNLAGFQGVPVDIINLIGRWFTNEYLHVFDKVTLSQWKISVKILLQLSHTET